MPQANETRTVRRARDTEAPVVADLINRAYEVESEFAAGTRTTPSEVLEMQARGQFLVVDSQQGDLAAAVFVEIEDELGHFEMLSVSPQMQGLGLGKRMVAVAELVCEAEGCTAMEIEIVNLREELGPFYHALGYRPSGMQPFPDDGTLLKPAHFVTMTKSLSEQVAA